MNTSSPLGETNLIVHRGGNLHDEVSSGSADKSGPKDIILSFFAVDCVMAFYTVADCAVNVIEVFGIDVVLDTLLLQLLFIKSNSSNFRCRESAIRQNDFRLCRTSVK